MTSHLKICFKHNSVDPEGKPLLTKIIDVTKERFGKHSPAITCFGVDLLYPDLVLEIDAMAQIQNVKCNGTTSGSVMIDCANQYLLAEKHGLEVKNPGMTVVIYSVKVTTRDKLKLFSINCRKYYGVRFNG